MQKTILNKNSVFEKSLFSCINVRYRGMLQKSFYNPYKSIMLIYSLLFAVLQK